MPSPSVGVWYFWEGQWYVLANRDYVDAAVTAGAPLTVVRASGTSASGTPTTAVATVTAVAGTQLVGWHVTAAQTADANTQLKVIVTYSDTTTDTDTSTANTATSVQANAGGIERTVGGAHSAAVALQSKAVTGIRVETAGTGTGTRAASISAIQVPL